MKNRPVELDGVLVEDHRELALLYEERMGQSGPSAGTLFYANSEQHEQKLRTLAGLVPKPRGDEIVLDVGCGFGALLEHLRITPCAYRGVDLVDGFIAIARKRHPDFTFEVWDYAVDPWEADHLVLAGVLSSVPNPAELLDVALAHARRTVAFDYTVAHRLPAEFTSLNRFRTADVLERVHSSGFDIRKRVDEGRSWEALGACRMS